MTEKESQAQDTHATEEGQQTQQKKPRRQSFFQISKGHMISTKDLWLQKFKSNPAPANPCEQIDPPLLSPLELPHIEQLQPINTDISSEIQFHQLPTEQDLQVITEDTIEDAKNHGSRNEDKNHQEKENEHNDENAQSVPGTTDDAADKNVVVADDPQHKQPNFKRSSILSKLFFSKQTFSKNDDSIIVTKSNINENQHHHQTELASGSDKEEDVNNEQAGGNNNNPDRYSLPLGRRINAVLSCIPTFKEKPSPSTDLDDEKAKKGCIIAAGGDTYSNEKLGSTIDKDTNTSRPVASI